MLDKKQFSAEEIAQLKELQDRFNNIVLQLGQINIEIIRANDELIRLQDLKIELESNYKKLRTEEVILAKDLSAKYGPGMLDPTSGEFTPEQK